MTLCVVGCSGGQGNPFARANPDPAEASLWIRVENRSYREVMIHALTRRGREEIGRVEGNQSDRFTATLRVQQSITFRVEFLDGRVITSNSLLVSPGDRIEIFVLGDEGSRVVARRS